MKKTLLTMAAALALVGCSKSELVETPIQEQNAIAFGTYVGDNAQTRASVVTTETLGVDGFGVNAYYTGQNDYADGAELNFMHNTKVTYNKDNQKWEYSPVKYWPNNSGDMVSFFAYGPYAKNDGDNNITQNGTSLDFVVHAEVKNQVDLIYNTNYEGTINKTKPSVEELIHFQFGHALSRISFTVEAAVDEVVNGNNLLDGNTRINVKKVALVADTDTDPLNPTGPFHTGGTLSLLQADEANPWRSTSGSQGFVFNATEHFYHTVKDVDAENKTGDKIDVVQLTRFNASEPQRLLNDDSYLMVIPQKDAMFKIYIEYDVISGGYENNGDGVYDESAIANKITSAEALTVTFEKGKAYNFNLVLGMTSVKIDAEVDDWGDEINGDDEWLPENEAQAIQGLGTEENPYEIRSLANLIAMRDNINGNANAAAVPDGGQPWNSAVYKQINDVTVTSTTRASENWEPIKEFSGKYLGNDKKIIGLTINNEDADNSKYYAWIANNSGTIQDLTMQDINISTACNTSAIAGINSGTITNCEVDGSLTGAYVGGLVYANSGTISDCINRAALSSSMNLGGITCENSGSAKIINCKNYGDGTSSGSESTISQGGIVAVNYAVIENCQNYGNVTGIRVGGIAGTISNNGTATACYNEGTITGIHDSYAHTGGIAGLIYDAKIIACYNRGAVKAADGVDLMYVAGGIAGYNHTGTSTIKGCYHNNDESYSNCGGLLGFNTSGASIVSEGNYYAGVDAAYGYSASENTDIATKVDDTTVTWETAKTAMNNVLNELYDNGTNPQYDWKYVESTTTPPLTLETGVADFVYIPYEKFGEGEADSKGIPTIYIDTAEDLVGIRENIANGAKYHYNGSDYDYQVLNYVQTATLDLSTVCGTNVNGEEVSWTPVFSTFKGTYDGGSTNGYQIKNLYINSSSANASLFGSMNGEFTDGAIIKNVNIISASVTVSGKGGAGIVSEMKGSDELENCSFNGKFDCSAIDYGGAIANSVYGNFPTIKNCHFNGEFIGGDDAGCIVGHFYGHWGTISGCTSSGTASWASGQIGGGIIGWISNGAAGIGYETKVTGCYNACTITGEGNVGGIFGRASDVTITACYNTGDITGKSAAGIVYEIYNSYSDKGQIIACYNTGSVTGSKMAAGIAANLYASGGSGKTVKINSCYNSGTIANTAESGSVGGLVYQYNLSSSYESSPNGTISNCCYSSINEAIAEGSSRFNLTNTQPVTVWDDTAISILNTDLSGWAYSANTGDDAATRPLIISKTE